MLFSPLFFHPPTPLPTELAWFHHIHCVYFTVRHAPSALFWECKVIAVWRNFSDAAGYTSPVQPWNQPLEAWVTLDAHAKVTRYPHIRTRQHTHTHLKTHTPIYYWPLFLSRHWQIQSCRASKTISVNNTLRQREQKPLNGCRHAEKHSGLE